MTRTLLDQVLACGQLRAGRRNEGAEPAPSSNTRQMWPGQEQSGQLRPAHRHFWETHAGRTHTCKRSRGHGRRHAGTAPGAAVAPVAARSAPSATPVCPTRHGVGCTHAHPACLLTRTVGSHTHCPLPSPPTGCTSQGRTPAALSRRLRVHGGQQGRGPEPRQQHRQPHGPP